MSIAEQLRSRSSLLTLNALAELLACHPQTLYKACRAGKMPHIRTGGRIRFDPRAIAGWLKQRSVG